MKGSLLLAEAATAHPDGTVSALRAGITHIWSPTQPIQFQGTVVVRFTSEPGDVGSHIFDLRCLGEDGAQVTPTLQGNFEAPKGGGAVHLILGVALYFVKFGRYEFVVRSDNHILDTWTITASKAPEPEAKSQNPPP